jgi:hypothetical protein
MWKKYIEFENYIDKSLTYFDWKYYINNNPDIPEDINSEEKAINYYNTIGKSIYQLPDKLIEQYEKRIEQLESEVLFLRVLVK